MIANPYRANVVEWFHCRLLTVGALVVGWSIGREGHARLGLTLLLLGSVGRRGHRYRPGADPVRHGNFDGGLP